MTTAAKKIHPFRSSGLNPRPEAPQQPADATTMQQAVDGLMRAAAGPEARLVTPRFTDTNGSWLRLGGHECRMPQSSIVSVSRAHDGRDIAVVAATRDDGRLWILVDTAEGIRELVGLPDNMRAELRRARFGK